MTDKKLDELNEDHSTCDEYYRKTYVKTMPWYEENLDHDIKNEIEINNYNTGNFLDLGTGPGTQAFQLSKYNFEVTATDIAPSAIEKAEKLSNKINFLVDDILDSKLPNKKFDFILDRGIFHTFDISQRPQYVKQIKRVLKDNGVLFLKCMSKHEKNLSEGDGFPHRFSKQDIVDLFKADFEIQKCQDSFFRGPGKLKFKALFTVLKKI